MRVDLSVVGLEGDEEYVRRTDHGVRVHTATEVTQHGRVFVGT